jgi:hypothetical protein
MQAGAKAFKCFVLADFKQIILHKGYLVFVFGIIQNETGFHFHDNCTAMVDLSLDTP